MKLWDKGYDIDRFTEEFTIGKDRELDVMLAKADVLGNMAHLKMLHHFFHFLPSRPWHSIEFC